MAIDWSTIKHFTPNEFDYPDRLAEDLIRGLDLTRGKAGVPMVITSDYRPGDPRAHGQGCAVDIADDHHSNGISTRWRFKIVKAALEVGFIRIGVYDKHIHLDTWTGPNVPRKVLWTGQST